MSENMTSEVIQHKNLAGGTLPFCNIHINDYANNDVHLSTKHNKARTHNWYFMNKQAPAK